MNFNEYQDKAMETACFTHEFYPYASLMIEAAEFADLVTKPMLRGDAAIVQHKELISEAGDVLWNLAAALHGRGISLQDVADYNVKKLADRKARGVIKGSGGER